MNILELAILKKMVGGGGSGTDNYNDLSNLPQINGETLAGNKTAENLGLQDALTFDSAPAEDSTNPVESGGVYNALAGKQDNLTFDGVYNASTNKAATESTVTNAIAGLDVSAFYVDADETISSISETDGKISVTKQDIAIASNQVTAMTGYTKPSSAPATPAIQTSDTANQAFGKLEFKADTNQTNILYSLQTGVKNTLNLNPTVLKSYANSGTWSGDTYLDRNKSFVVDGNTITVTGSAESNGARMVIFVGDIPANTVISGCPEGGSTSGINSYCIAIEDSNGTFVAADTGNSVTITTALTNATIYIGHGTGAVSSPLVFRPMICTKAAWDQEPNVFRPFALPNYDLTVREAEDRAALIECVDEGAKNIIKIFNKFTTPFGLTITKNADESITVNGSVTSADYIHIGSISAKAGTYRMLPSSVTLSENVVSFLYTQDNHLASSGSRVSYTYPSDWSTAVVLFCPANTTYNNATFYPMICTEANWKVSQNYAPYALPNTDLTRMMTPFFTVPINHNMIYRGQNLGDTLTADQDTALSSGNFTDLYLGDYWTKQITIPAFYEVTAAEPADWSTNYTSYYTKSGDTYTPVTGDTAPTWAANTYYERLVPSQTVTLKAVIADFDTFYAGYDSGYAAINSHHAAVVVHGFNNVVWNKTNTTAGGYVNSLIHKWLVGSALPQIETWFGSAKVLSHQKLLTNAITGDAASGWAWSSQKISLLSENQMYGSKIWGNSKAANGGYEPGEAFKHLNVFNHIDANLLFGNKNIWLRDIASDVKAVILNGSGYADSAYASDSWFAPAALILLS